MNYWPRWVSAIRKRTAHLPLIQMGAYDRLLDHYYAEEKPLPGDLDACCRIAGAVTRPERDAVRSVLAEFFTMDEGVYRNPRGDEEIAVAQAAASRAALTLENARLLEESRKRASKERTILESTARIGSAINIENILQAAAEELERVLGDSEVVLQFNTENVPTEKNN